MLRVEGLNVHYGGIHALKNVSLHVPEEKIVTLVGANGAGKSTLAENRLRPRARHERCDPLPGAPHHRHRILTGLHRKALPWLRRAGASS